jgi:hypothetical protein
MSSINNNRPVSSSPSTSATDATKADAAKSSSSSNGAAQPGKDQYDTAQTAAQYQQSINQEILPDNSGEHASKSKGKAHHGGTADDTTDLNGPSAQIANMPKV